MNDGFSIELEQIVRQVLADIGDLQSDVLPTLRRAYDNRQGFHMALADQLYDEVHHSLLAPTPGSLDPHPLRDLVELTLDQLDWVAFAETYPYREIEQEQR